MDPNDAAARFNLGDLFYDLGDLESAEKETLEAVRLDPNFTMSYLTLGNICIDQERLAEAIQYFELYLKKEKSPQAAEMIAEVKAVVEGLKEEMRH
ncbi:tetratricopeptide repeat protein [Geotalea toluenoxydans]|uniref:tetratricopeptide repeat protein n=1 Tax=Geotalea toluenoxydans TaxID=421624 RepID=UPI00243663D2|nr:tetratricopeptide repeat protein [Geotalea toluenoxydans]